MNDVQLMRRAREVLVCYAAARRALVWNRRGWLDDKALASRLRAIERRMAALRGTHWALDALVSWLGRPVLLSRPLAMLLLLMASSWFLRCAGAQG